MHMARKALLGGAAALALIGFCGLAAAKDAALHTMTVRAPDGGTITVQYTGDVAPQISFASGAQATGFADFDAPFAMMQRIAADMDRQMVQMMRQANEMMAQVPDTNPVFGAGLWNMPTDMPGLSAISSVGSGFCMKSVEISSTGDGKPPHVVTHSAGNCAQDAPAQAHPSVHGTGPRTPI
jgi:hypothetical protein